MKFTFPVLLATAVLSTLSADAQQQNEPNEIPPRFIRGDKVLANIIKDSLVYPPSARKDGIGGKVVVRFSLDTLGNVTEVSVKEGVRRDIDDEAMRLIRLLNGWTPGIQNGKKVRVEFVMPLYFFPDNRFRKKFYKNDTESDPVYDQ